ncbi:MAG TPA: VCBS repeat-containing protein [Puia sp.]|jgi:hypothetical protein
MKAVIFGLCLLFLFACHSPSIPGEAPLFQLQSPAQTGIAFVNDVKDSTTLNIFNYRNFYNGGGVAIGDVNNDGKPDIFFTANQGSNRLYLNEGNWKFRDITQMAGVAGLHKWHTGVTMADINGDGWLDIYVSNSGEPNGSKRENELYINQKDGTFKEEARQYGLDDKGIGTQAIFFDYDHDGDLDCFILNNSFRPIESFGYDRYIRNTRSPSGGHRLYRNDGGHFSDVSAEAGIYGSEIGFGLGVTAGDLNNDGWPDLYVSNDFFEKDYLYINQHNGTFREMTEDAIGHLSLSSMGSDMADINNDGNLDIFTTDMLPEGDYRLKTTTKFDNYNVQNAKLKNDFHHQFTSNCLQLNNGDGTFSEIACLAGIEATDWSWGALSFDFNNDGWKDIFVSNGISKDLTNQDFLDFFSDAATTAHVKEQGFNYKEFLDKMPSTPISNYAFVNQKNLRFTNESKSLGLAAPAFSNGAAYGDLDGDGDIDLVVNNENSTAFVYRNMTSERKNANYLTIQLKGTAPNTFGFGARVTLYAGGQQQVLEQMPCRGFESSVEPVLHFGLGQANEIDSLVVGWPNMKQQTLYHQKADTTLILHQDLASQPLRLPGNNSHPLFQNTTATDITGAIRHCENSFIDFDLENLVPKMLSTEGPKLAIGDVNGDGLPDFITGNAAHDTTRLFLQLPNGHFAESPQFAFARDKDDETIGLELFDADNDGDLDLVAASGGGQDPPGSVNGLTRLYLNDGKGNFTRSLTGWPLISLNASCVRTRDFDGDGLIDVFIGGRSVTGSYGRNPGSVLLKNKGKGVFTNVTASLAPDLLSSGMVTDARWADIDGDGQKELVVVGDWMPVTIYKYTRGRLSKTKELPHSSGWWNCLSIADMDGDGRPDLIAGNNGLNSKIRADEQHPARLFEGDFSNNGRSQCIAAYYKTDGKSYPINLRSDIVGQIPLLKKKFLRYDAYAGKTLEEVLTEEQRNKALQLSVEQTQSCVFYNEGNQNFTMTPLPLRAQFSAVFGIWVSDLNNDKRPDLLLGGNFYGLKPEIGRLDASYGVTLITDSGPAPQSAPTRHFHYLSPAESGLFIRGEVRDLQSISTPQGPTLIAARNNDSLQLFRKTISK